MQGFRILTLFLNKLLTLPRIVVKRGGLELLVAFPFPSVGRGLLSPFYLQIVFALRMSKYYMEQVCVIGHWHSIFSVSSIPLVTSTVYYWCLRSHWSLAQYILSGCHPFGR